MKSVLFAFLRLVPPVLILTLSAAANSVIFERALPTGPNVNADAAGNGTPDANRSNIKWAPAGQTILGDDFQLPFGGVIDSITVWMVGENPTSTQPSDELFSLRLFSGTDSNVVLTASAYSFTRVTYDNGQDYWNPARGIFEPIFELTFANLNWSFEADTLYDFAVEGLGTDRVLSLHASNGCLMNDPNDLYACVASPGLSESWQDRPDGAFLEFDGTPETGPYVLSRVWYSAPGRNFDANNNPLPDLWDKASDINVRIAGTLVPEPSTYALIGLGLGALAYLRRRS